MKAFMVDVVRKVKRDLPVVLVLTIVVTAIMFVLEAMGAIHR